MQEYFNRPDQIGIGGKLERLNISVLCEPRKSLSPKEQEILGKVAMEIIRLTSGRSDIAEEEVLPYLFGQLNRGKTLAIIKDQTNITKGFIAGQILNVDNKPRLFNGEPVFHISSAHILPGLSPLAGRLTLREICKCLYPKLRYFSAFTQSPRIYEYIKKISKNNIFPNHDHTEYSDLREIHGEIIEFLSPVSKIENGVFKHKIKNSFYKSKQLSKDKAINQWFYKKLGINPLNGDLLLMLTLIKA